MQSKKLTAQQQKNFEAIWSKTLAAVDRHGWAVTSVFGGDNSPPFSYTIGLCRLGKPDLVMKGVGHDAAQSILNEIASAIVAGRLSGTAGEEVKEACSMPLRLVSTQDALPIFHLGATRFAKEYDHKLVMLQVAWPDESGKFHWEDGFDRHMSELQRLDKESVTLH